MDGGPGGDGDGAGGQADGQSRRRAEREGQIGYGRDAGRGLVADELAELGERVELGGGAQIALIGQAFLVEGENVEDDMALASSNAIE